MTAAPADVCLLLEGTYPYVAGGVSSWVHDLLRGLPEVTFALFHLGPRPGAFATRKYDPPPNVVAYGEIFLEDAPQALLDPAQRAALRARVREAAESPEPAPPALKVLEALRALHVEGRADARVLEGLAAADVDVGELLHGRAAFEAHSAIAEAVAPGASFLDLFWHLRAMHVPLVRLARAAVPAARAYHAVSTGYAGLVGALASVRTGRPLLVTEHGLYAREREMELARARWLGDGLDAAALRRLWVGYFRALSRLAYGRASRILTLSEVNRRKQLEDGAPADRIAVVPNGVAAPPGLPRPERRPPGAPLRVAFVGRVVPIKDVATLVRAADLALRDVPLELAVVGPLDEDPGYVERCRELAASLGREGEIQFTGPRPMNGRYQEFDVVVLTSFSEGQPLVVLEAGAHGVPVVATDVGACRELLEGRPGADAALGASGLVTPVADPTATAAALVRLARDPGLRLRMGEAGRARVAKFYQREETLDRYRTLYSEAVSPWPASASSSRGSSSAARSRTAPART